MKQKITVCLVSDQHLTHGGDCESNISQLSDAITAQGIDTKIVAPPPALGGDWRTKPGQNIQYTPFPIEYSKNLLRVGAADAAIYCAQNLAACIDPALYRRQILYVCHAEEAETWTPTTFLADQPMVAVSRFVARSIEASIKIRPSVLYPFIEKERYETDLRPQFVTFISPVRQKDADLAVAIAQACPSIPFLFVAGCSQSPADLELLKCGLDQAPNVRLLPWQADRREVYAATKLLLFPCQWEEGFGRIIVEAQISGIPALASAIGGIPEALGHGGILLPPDAPANDWAKALRKIWDNAANWLALANKAKRNAKAHLARQHGQLAPLLSLARGDFLHPSERRWLCKHNSERAAKCGIIVTHHNYAHLIDQLLCSVSTQTHENFSCVIVDDCSSPDQRDLLLTKVHAHGDRRCKVLALPENQGQVRAFFAGMSACQGDFITMIDPDDIYSHQFLEFMVRAHLNPEQVAPVASCEMGSFEIAGGPLLRFWSRQHGRDTITGDLKGAEERLAAAGYSLYHPKTFRGWPWGTTASFMFRRESLEKIRPTDWTVGARYDLDTYCAQSLHPIGGTLIVDRVLSWRGRHGQNIAFADKIFAQVQSRNKEGAFGLMNDLRPVALREFIQNSSPEELEAAHFLLSELSSNQLWKIARSYPAILALLLEKKRQAQNTRHPAR